MKANRSELPAELPEAPPSDAALLSRLCAGDVGALGELYDRHFVAVQRFVARATNGAEDVDDIAQNVFLTAAKIADRYDGRRSARPWILGIAARLVQRRGRRLGQIARLIRRWSQTRDPAQEPERALEARSSLDQVQATLSRMSAGKRLVVLMTELEGMTGPEIAAVLQIPIGTVWTRLLAARRELRASIRSEAP